jgi:L,D-transpeptidase ErfK/SrfK
MRLIVRLLAIGAALLAFVPLSTPVGAAGEVFPFGEVVGAIGSYDVSGDESLHEVAVKKGLGYNEIADANPGIDPWMPREGTKLVIPTLWVLPEAPFEGIVVNLAEMRLFHYIEAGGRKLVRTYPVGIGTEAFDTPTGSFTIKEKLEDSFWVVPESVREEDPSLPAVVPPGPDNPLGAFGLRLSNTAYLIHGTNRPFGIGRRVSHGCIRMYPEDIKELHGAVEPGAPVSIIYQPVKFGSRGGVLYVEVHSYFNTAAALMREAVAILKRRGFLDKVDMALLRRAIEERTGVPVPVTANEAAVPPE